MQQLDPSDPGLTPPFEWGIPMHERGDTIARYTYDAVAERSRLVFVRSILLENGEEVYLDEGPWDGYLAELVIADIGVDASIPRGIGRVPVLRARLVRE